MLSPSQVRGVAEFERNNMLQFVVIRLYNLFVSSLLVMLHWFTQVDLMADVLHWDSERKKKEIELALDFLRTMNCEKE
jgi:hypothetical protein